MLICPSVVLVCTESVSKRFPLWARTAGSDRDATGIVRQRCRNSHSSPIYLEAVLRDPVGAPPGGTREANWYLQVSIRHRITYTHNSREKKKFAPLLTCPDGSGQSCNRLSKQLVTLSKTEQYGLEAVPTTAQ